MVKCPVCELPMSQTDNVKVWKCESCGASKIQPTNEDPDPEDPDDPDPDDNGFVGFW